MGIGRALKGIFMVVWFPANIFVAVCTVVSAYIGSVNPVAFPLGQIINMTFPFWISASFVLLLVNLIVSRRRLLWLSIAVMLICINPLVNNFPMHILKPSVSREEKKTSFTVMTYNVFNFTDHQGESPSWGNRTISYIISQASDIVCLQEAFPLLGRQSFCNKSQQDSLKSLYPYYIDMPNRAGEMILSRFPVRLLEVPSSPDWGSGQYTAYAAEIEGREVTIVNCHLQSLGLTPDDKALYRELTDKESKPTRNELSQAKHNIIPKLLEAFKIRAEQADSISRFLADATDNVILMGDFNDVPGSYAYRTMINAGLKDAYNSCAFGPMVTYNDNRFYFRIDHIFYRGDMRAVRIKRGNLKSSDHYPLKATFVWDSGQK
ncbi:MAG: endonuclease/exonuclease/phosphatase family protein [Lachnospiraceae bacterium]|nr:endonuclease/exonuclease/phosphatase family protein [Lachnospiraceae bacterium]